MGELLLYWYLVELVLKIGPMIGALGVIVTAIGATASVLYIFFKDDDGVDGKFAHNVCSPSIKPLLSIGIPFIMVNMLIPPKEIAYTFIALKAGEEISKTQVAEDVYGEVKDIYGLAKEYLTEQMKDAE